MNDRPHISPIEPGIYLDVPFDEYLAWPAMNQSTLKHATKSMAHLRAKMDEPPCDKTPPHFAFGSLVHAGVLEPIELLDRFVVMPDFTDGLVRDDGTPYKSPRASNAYKELVADFRVEHHDKTVVDADAYDAMRQCVRSLGGNSRATAYLSGCLPEVSICWLDADTDVLCKARLDGLDQDACRITDVKTNKDVGDFEWSMHKWGYDVQAAFYSDGVATLLPDEAPWKFCIVALDSGSPFCVRAARVGDTTLVAGRCKYKRWLAQYAQSLRDAYWPGYSNPVEWSLPPSKLGPVGAVELSFGGTPVSL